MTTTSSQGIVYAVRVLGSKDEIQKIQHLLNLSLDRLPAVLVDLNAFDRNVAQFAQFVLKERPKLKLRVVTKSLRVPELIRRVLGSSPVYHGLMCYSAEEILFLAEQGFDDFLLAYPTLQLKALEALAELSKTKKIALVVDSTRGIEAAAQAVEKVGGSLSCVIEFDVSWRWREWSLGARRSGVRTVQEILELIKKIDSFSGLKFHGLMAYESQVAGLPDRLESKHATWNFLTKLIRDREASAVATRRGKILQELGSVGVSCQLVNAGGSGSVSYALKEAELTELALGSAFLAPHLFTSYSNLELEPALYVALEIVRSSSNSWITCQGGGYVASGPPGWDRLLKPIFPLGARLSALEGCGEVQTPLKIFHQPAQDWVGKVAFFRPAKAGEIAERFSEYLLGEKGEGKKISLKKTLTYRGWGQCFL